MWYTGCRQPWRCGIGGQLGPAALRRACGKEGQTLGGALSAAKKEGIAVQIQRLFSELCLLLRRERVTWMS